MKIMITWKLHPGKLRPILAQFSQMTPEQEQALGDNKVKLIGRWHDLVRGKGAAIYETDSPEALSKYALAWNEHMDLDISVVLDDEEARAVGKSQASSK